MNPDDSSSDGRPPIPPSDSDAEARSSKSPPPTGRPIEDLPKPASPPGDKPPPKARPSGSPSFGNATARSKKNAPPDPEAGRASTPDSSESPSDAADTAGSRKKGGAPGSSSSRPNTEPVVTTVIDLPRGAYAKGTLWKWGCRAAGGGIVVALLMLLVGAPAAAFTFLLFTAGVAASLTFRVGLKTDPTLELPANLPIPNVFGVALRIQDKLGDIMLTPAWNAIRQSTGTKWD